MVDYATEQYLRGRIKRVQECEPATLENNRRFFENFDDRSLEVARRVYNFVMEKVNWQGHKYTVPEGLNILETREGLAKGLTDFQAGVDNLDDK